MTCPNTKSENRRHFLDLRGHALPLVQPLILDQVLKELSRRRGLGLIKGFIGIYFPLKGEIDLTPMKLTLEWPIALPASYKDGRLSFHPWTTTPLQQDECMIPAPLQEPALDANAMSLLLVPAVAIDQYGMRIGYGGGFYDRLRAHFEWRSVPALVVLPKACVSSVSFSRDKWDIPFDGWITEDGINKSFKVDSQTS